MNKIGSKACSIEDGFLANLKVRYLSEGENGFTARIRGCDPRAQTCRGKLQNKRSELNQEINKEMMLRTGAEKLYRATNNKKLKETVSLELRFVNSKLQHLMNQLADLNSSVDIYQNDKTCFNSVPMIPLGLKETLEVDFTDPLKDMILEHYSEDTEKFNDAINKLNALRQAMRTPTRDHNGTTLLFKYYSQLYFLERRFFSPERNPGLHFEWYDALTGVPSNQKTLAFEKANVLFNIAAVYTQLGARQDRSTSAGIDSSVDSFLRAASMFNFIQNNFSNAPSNDLRPDTLEMFINLMLAQARECLFEKLVNITSELENIEQCLEAGQEAAQVAEAYNRVHACISIPPVKDYVPYSWILLVQVKSEHFKALSHYFVSLGLLNHSDESLSLDVENMLDCIQINHSHKTTLIDIKVPKTSTERRLLGKSHLREALMHHEESLRVQRMCKQLQRISSLKEKLIAAHNRALDKYEEIEEEDDFIEVLDPHQIQAATKFQLTITSPDFNLHRAKDLFYDLGPIAIFNAKNHWTAPRLLKLSRNDEPSYGLSLRGDSPVIVAAVDTGSVAEAMDVKEGDFIVNVGTVDTKYFKHDEMVELVRAADDVLQLKLVTPTDRNYLRPFDSSMSSPCCIRVVTTLKNSGEFNSRISPTGSVASTKSKDSQKKLTWNPFRRVASKGKHDTRSIFSSIPSR